MGLLDDSADVLRAAGLTVVEMPGWKGRGETDGPFYNRGIFFHHDGEGLGYNSNPNDDFNVAQYMSQNGVNGSQFWVSRKGVWYVLATGRKWHAGIGGPWRGIPANSGNSYCCAMETDHTPGNPWDQAQLDAINKGCRALAQHYGWNVDQFCCGHKEYAPDRKIDPDHIDLEAWRTYMKSASAPATPTTPVDEIEAIMADSAAREAFKKEIELEIISGIQQQLRSKNLDPKTIEQAFEVANNNLQHGYSINHGA